MTLSGTNLYEDSWLCTYTQHNTHSVLEYQLLSRESAVHTETAHRDGAEDCRAAMAAAAQLSHMHIAPRRSMGQYMCACKHTRHTPAQHAQACACATRAGHDNAHQAPPPAQHAQAYPCVTYAGRTSDMHCSAPTQAPHGYKLPAQARRKLTAKHQQYLAITMVCPALCA